MGYSKWISGALGWYFLGPIGGLVGFALGALIDSSGSSVKIYTGQTNRDGFVVSLLVLVSAMMKADGKIVGSTTILVDKDSDLHKKTGLHF